MKVSVLGFIACLLLVGCSSSSAPTTQATIEAGVSTTNAAEEVDKSTNLKEIDPTDALAYSNRGSAYAKLGQFQEAINDFDQAIKLDPTPLRYNNRGLAHGQFGQFQEALNDFDQAIKLDPTSSRYNNRGMAYGELGQVQEAINDFDQAIKLDPTNARAYSNRGLGHNAFGQFQEAINDFDRACELDTEYCTVADKSHQQASKANDSQHDLGQGIKLDPTSFMTNGEPIDNGEFEITLRHSLVGNAYDSNKKLEAFLHVKNLTNSRAQNVYWKLDVYAGDGTTWLGECSGNTGGQPPGATKKHSMSCDSTVPDTDGLQFGLPREWHRMID